MSVWVIEDACLVQKDQTPLEEYFWRMLKSICPRMLTGIAIQNEGSLFVEIGYITRRSDKKYVAILGSFLELKGNDFGVWILNDPLGASPAGLFKWLNLVDFDGSGDLYLIRQSFEDLYNSATVSYYPLDCLGQFLTEWFGLNEKGFLDSRYEKAPVYLPFC